MIGLQNGIQLRKLVRLDAAELYAAIDRDRNHISRWLPWLNDAYGRADALKFLELSEARTAAGDALDLAILIEGKIGGAIGFHQIDKLNRSSSIGYWLGSKHGGKGIVTEACRALVTEGFRTYKLHRIEIRCATGNTRSCAIPHRLGFTEEGILHEAEWLHDHWVDLRVFSMLEPNWR